MAARGTVWSFEETNELISLWSDEKIQALLESARHNHKVFAKLASGLTEKGYELRGGKQCQDKIKKLKMKYREILDHNNRSGKGRKNWEFFEKMDEVLGTKPTSRPRVLLQSVEGEEENETLSDEGDSEEEDREENENTLLTVLKPRARIERSFSNSTEDSLNDITERQEESEDDAMIEDVMLDLPSSSTPKTPKRAAPDSKKPRSAKKNKTEKAVDSAVSKFTESLKEMDERFLRHEEERQKKEEESKEGFYTFLRQMEENRIQVEERTREQDRNHEMRMFNMMLQVMGRSQQVMSSASNSRPSNLNSFPDQPSYENMPSFSGFIPYNYEG